MIELKTKICYLIFGMSLFSAAIFTIPLGGYQLSVFRFLIFAFFLFELIDINRKKEMMNQYDSLMLFWLSYAFISYGWISDTTSWSKAVFFLTVAFLVTRWFHLYFNTYEKIINACKFFALGILLHNFIGWYEMATQDYHWISEKYLMQITYLNTPVPISVFYNPNDFATILSFGFFVLLVVQKETKNKFIKSLWILTAVSSLTLIVLTHSRANLIGILLGLTFIAMIRFGLSYKKIVITLLVLIALFVSLLLTDFGNHLLDFIDLYLSFDMENGSEQQRSVLLKNAFCVFFNSYGLGTGAGNLSFRMLTDGCYSIKAGNVHNWWFEILVTYGVVIFIWYVCNYISLLKVFFLQARRSFLSLNLCAFLICFIIGCISSSSCLTSEPLWCAFALIYASSRVKLS